MGTEVIPSHWPRWKQGLALLFWIGLSGSPLWLLLVII